MSDLVTRCRIASCLIALAQLAPSPATAQTVDPMVEEGVQLRIDRLELAHLFQTGQVDNPGYQAKYNALQQRDRAYTQKLARLDREGRLALGQKTDNHFAVVFPPIQAKWNAEAARLSAEAEALSAKRSIELAADVPVAAQLQADRIILQRQQQQGVAPQDAEAKSADAAARIAALQEKYTGYGGNWVTWFNRQMQTQAAQVVRERDLAERAADTTSEIGRDAKRATELRLAMARNDQRLGTGAITVAEQTQADAPFQTELQTIKAKYGAGGSLAVSANDFNERVETAVRLATDANIRQWVLDARAEVAKNRAATQPGSTPTQSASTLQPLNPAAEARARKEQQEWEERAAALEARANRPKVLAWAGVALVALALYAFSAWLPRMSGGNGSTPSTDSYKVGRSVIEIDQVTGQVLGTEKRSETHISSSGGGGYSYQGTGYTSAPRIHSTIVTKHEFWLKLADDTEKSVQLSGLDIPLRPGQRVTLISARAGERASGSYVVLVNHSERAHRFLRQGDNLYNDLGMKRLLTGAIGLAGFIVALSLVELSPITAIALGSGFLAAFVVRIYQKETGITRLHKELERHAQLAYQTAITPSPFSAAMVSREGELRR